jgi:7 transmembrane sweet-taste receptor of 3 GCPR
MKAHTKEAPGKNLRKQVQSGQLATRILMYTAPQVFIQIGLAIAEPRRYSVYMNEDESIGSARCSSGSDGWLTLYALGYMCFCGLILVLLLTAHQTRILPSLFNETRVIFDSTLATLVIVILGMGIMAVSSNPTTSPAVAYLLGITLTLSSTLNTSLRIIMPKLRMIWRGETVLVSKLVSDHKQAVLKDDMLYKHSRRASATEYAHAAPDETMFDLDEQSKANASTSSAVAGDAATEDFLGDAGDENLSTHLVIHPNKAPPKWLVLRLFDMQSKLSRINDRIMSGAAVPGQEWDVLRKTSHCLSNSFRRKVRFAWEAQNDGDICFSEEAALSLDVTRNSNRQSSAIISESSFMLRSARSLRDMATLLDDITEENATRAATKEEEYPQRVVHFNLRPDEGPLRHPPAFP